MNTKKNRQNNFYFSNKLKRKLEQIPHYALTVVEAQSGFGKTTAVREYLKNNLAHGACEYWYTCLGESELAAWSGICDLLAKVDNKVAQDLRNLSMPTVDTLFYLTTYLREINCQAETYLVIDNYQLINCGIPRELLGAFSLHGNPNLHLVCITQPLKASQRVSFHNSNILSIDASALFFDQKDIASLFRMEGVRLTDEQVENVYISTGGWVAAICLQIINYKETGAVALTNNIEQLVENAIWKKLAHTERDFLLAVGVLDSFNLRHAANMIDQKVLPEELKDLINANDFIRFLPGKQLYSIHSILQEFLRNRLMHHRSDEYKNEIFRKASKVLAADSQFYSAIKFFLLVKDYEAILATPFDQDYTDAVIKNYQTNSIDVLLNECPLEILRKYPAAVLRLAYQALAFENIQAYDKLSRLLYETIQGGTFASEDERREIHGEYMLMQSVASFNDFEQMRDWQQKAWLLLGRPSIIFKEDTPWIFGTVSALDILWSQSGQLENGLQCMDDMMAVYLKLTQCNGAGANSLLRAEALLMRGDDISSEILCHKALYRARSFRQTSVCICAELVLARIAILRGDTDGYFTAVKNIQNYGKENSKLYVLRMIEQGLSALSLILDNKDYITPWLYDMDSIRRAVYPPVIPQALVLHLSLLLMEKRYTEFTGALQSIEEEEEQTSGNIRYLMPKLYHLLFQAILHNNTGAVQQAQRCIQQALTVALPDKIYLPFAQLHTKIYALLEQAKLSINDRAGINAIIALGKRQQKGSKAILKGITSYKSPLTPREREVALLIKSRLTAREVAEKLYISETTVRTILRNVYSKLDVHSKTELEAKTF